MTRPTTETGIAARQRIEGGAADVDGGVLGVGDFARVVHAHETKRAIVRWPQCVHEDGAFDCVDRPAKIVRSKPRGGRRGQ